MEYYAGIDVSLKDSSVCVVDATAKSSARSRWRASLKRSFGILTSWDCRSVALA